MNLEVSLHDMNAQAICGRSGSGAEPQLGIISASLPLCVKDFPGSGVRGRGFGMDINAEKQRGRGAEMNLEVSLHDMNAQAICWHSGSGAEPQLGIISASLPLCVKNKKTHFQKAVST